MQFVQHFGYIDRANLLRQYAHRPQRARLPDIQLALLRGVHHDRDHGGLRIALDRLNGLQAIHTGHEMIHENRVRPMPRQIIDRLLG